MIEAMKQALEALYPISHNSTDDYRGQADKAITSLRQAIEQAEKQEPVAKIVPCYTPSGKRVALNTEYQHLPIGTDLYTTPQQRTWVGLTQEEIDIAFDDTQEGGGFNEFAEAIEAKLKQKNGYAEDKNT